MLSPHTFNLWFVVFGCLLLCDYGQGDMTNKNLYVLIVQPVET